MRALLLIGWLSLISARTVVLAQNNSSREFQGLFHQYFQSCMKDWDKATRMTKKEWGRTCRRLANDRVKFRLEHGYK
jgi:hypothetical protein